MSWTAPGNTGGSDITGYRITYSLAGENSWTTIDTETTATSYIITGLTKGSLYDINIAAINSEGAGSTANLTNVYVVKTDIENCVDLQNIRYAPSATFTVKNNIDCSVLATADGGQGFIPITEFGGELNGELCGAFTSATRGCFVMDFYKEARLA